MDNEKRKVPLDDVLQLIRDRKSWTVFMSWDILSWGGSLLFFGGVERACGCWLFPDGLIPVWGVYFLSSDITKLFQNWTAKVYVHQHRESLVSSCSSRLSCFLSAVSVLMLPDKTPDDAESLKGILPAGGLRWCTDLDSEQTHQCRRKTTVKIHFFFFFCVCDVYTWSFSLQFVAEVEPDSLNLQIWIHWIQILSSLWIWKNYPETEKLENDVLNKMNWNLKLI